MKLQMLSLINEAHKQKQNKIIIEKFVERIT